MGTTPVRQVPRPVNWVLWLGGAALLSVLIGFVLGLAQPKQRQPPDGSP